MKWTNEVDVLLLKMWAEGKSSSEIAEVLGVTRNAVIGRATRLRRRGEIVNRRQITVARKIHKTKEHVMEAEPTPSPEPTSQVESEAASGLAQSLLNLRYGQCKWPLETTFCEEEREQGRPYCARHRKMSFRPAYEGAKK